MRKFIRPVLLNDPAKADMSGDKVAIQQDDQGNVHFGDILHFGSRTVCPSCQEVLPKVVPIFCPSCGVRL